jgi:hypothetical protein
LVSLLHNRLEADADCAPEQPLQEIGLRADSLVIEDALLRPIGGAGLDERRLDLLIARIELGDVRVERRVLVAPGPVDQNDDPLHGRAPQRRDDTSLQRELRAGLAELHQKLLA